MDSQSQTVASQVSFAELCGLLEKLQKTTGNDKKKKVLKDFIDKWRNYHNELHKDTSNTTDSFYPAMRLLLPHLEKERIAYGIKEHMFAKLLIEVMCLGKDSPDANKLLHYKAPKSARVDVGDFASIAYFVLKNRCPERGSLSIAEVNKDLDDIAAGNAGKARDVVRARLLHLLTHLSATEQKWLIRMIMKEMKVGVSQASILSVFHPDAEELYNVNNSLQKVCLLLHNPKTRSHEIGISVFSPFSPMLGERASPDKVEKLMDNQTYLIETKYDGERVLLHKNGHEFKYYSRSGNEYTHVFGSNSFEGTLTPHIADSFLPAVDKCILDGEMLGYHAETDTFGSKGEQFDIKSRDCAERTGYQPCVQVFDVLLLNDKVLTNTPLRDRLPLLEDVFVEVKGRIVRSQYTTAQTNQDCADALNEAIDNREEGIMVKKADSVYKPNTRKGGWFKIKPEYIGGLTDELDLLVVGASFGLGHRGGLLSHFLCGVSVPSEDGSKPSEFFSFCKVGSGYTKKQLKDFNNSLAEHWRPYDKRSPPKHLILAQGFKEKPDVWLPPDKSKVLQVKAAEIIESKQFRTGCTLRFPRVEMIRDDKPWYDCMTTVDIEELRQKSGGKLTGPRFELGEEAEPVKKKRKIVSRVVKPSLMSQFRGADTSQVVKISEVLSGKELCVVNGPVSQPKQDLETKIVELGGTITQNPDSTTLCVIAEKVAVRVNNLIKTGKYDVVRASWLVKVIEAGRFIPWSPSDMIHTTAGTQAEFDEKYDCHGDGYVGEITEEELKARFASMENMQHISQTEMAEIEDEYFPDDSPYGLFRTCKFYLDSNLVLGDTDTHITDSPLDLLGLELRFFGGQICDQLEKSVSHVVVHSSDVSRVCSLRDERRSRTRKFHIVTESWVRHCMSEGEICTERLFEPDVA